VAASLGRRVAWPENRTWIGERLPRVIDDGGLIRALIDVIEEYERLAVNTPDRVLVHADMGFHNLAFSESDEVNGAFDYDGAAWADRHHDFRYLLFDTDREDMLEAALRVYEPAVGRSLDRTRIRLYNAACGICYLAFRAGVPAEQIWCGRTQAEDIRWVRAALARLVS